jgi:hypothetical protein
VSSIKYSEEKEVNLPKLRVSVIVERPIQDKLPYDSKTNG